MKTTQQALYEIIRPFGYATSTQCYEIAEAISKALATTAPESEPADAPVAIVGGGFQLLYCREDWAERLNVGDHLCTHPAPSQSADPFYWQKHAVFPTNILGGPMREYAPGKWESARWPSESQSADQVRNALTDALVRCLTALPMGYEVEVLVEHGSCCVLWNDPHSNPCMIEGEGYLSDDVSEALEACQAHFLATSIAVKGTT